jgi:hypothetical protein
VGKGGKYIVRKGGGNTSRMRPPRHPMRLNRVAPHQHQRRQRHARARAYRRNGIIYYMMQRHHTPHTARNDNRSNDLLG